MKSIAILTSGGDSPGMNACIRAVVRVAAARGVKVLGVEHGYDGLMEGRFRELTRALPSGALMPDPEVDLIGNLGGTILGSVRSKRFMTPEGRAEAAKQTDVMLAWQPNAPGGTPTEDPLVQRFPIALMLKETAALLDGSSKVTQRRVKMLETIEGALAL